MRQAMRVGLVLVLWGGVSEAQSVINPTRLVFDHDAVSRTDTTVYRVGYFALGATQPTHTVEVPKEQTVVDGGSFAAALPRPALGQWQVRVQACAGALCSEWSVPSDPFGFAPMPPVSVRVVRP